MMNEHSEVPLILQRALRNARVKRMPSGQIIFYENDLPQEVYVVKEGIVKVYDIDEQGNEKILHLVKTPAIIPFAFFSGLHDPLRWFYSTLTDCELYVFSFVELQRIALTDSAIGEAITNTFSKEVHELLVRLSSLSKTSARDKVVAALNFLLEAHATEKRAQWWQVNFPVSHQLIADISGITRETAAIMMKELQSEKVVRNPKVTVLEINKKMLLQSTVATDINTRTV